LKIATIKKALESFVRHKQIKKRPILKLLA
jgi:hypothetical protein